MALDRLTQITSSGITSGITLPSMNVSGVLTATSVDTPKFDTNDSGVVVAGIITATTFQGGTFVGNGAGLVGVTASGSGVNISNNDSIVGVAGTINFGSGIDVSPVSAGVVTTTVSSLTVGTGATINGTTNTITALTNAEERLRITSQGRLGIGTINPDTLLSINGSTSTQKLITLSSGTSKRNNYIGVESSDNLAIGADEDNEGNDSSIRFRVDGSERVRITSDGNVGIGTDDPTDHLQILHTNGKGLTFKTTENHYAQITGDSNRTGSDDHLLAIEGHWNGTPVAEIAFKTGDDTSNKDNGEIIFRTSSQNNLNGSERLRIDSSGRLLVGATSARTDFATTPRVQFEGGDFPTTSISLARNSNDSGRPTFFFGKSRGTTNGATTIVQDDDALGAIEFRGADGDQLLRAALITGSVDGTPGNDDMPGRLVFSTNSGGTTATERLRITKDGAFGLGGENYGTSGQIIKSNGSSAAPTWQNLYSFMFYGEQNTPHSVDNTEYTAIRNLGTRDFYVGDSSIAVFSESDGTLTIGASGAGYWFLSMGAGVDDVQANDYTQCVIGKNGTGTDRGTVISSYSRGWNSGGANQIVNANTSCMVNLSANDVVRFYVYHQEGTTENTEQNRTFAMGYRIG